MAWPRAADATRLTVLDVVYPNGHNGRRQRTPGARLGDHHIPSTGSCGRACLPHLPHDGGAAHLALQPQAAPRALHTPCAFAAGFHFTFAPTWGASPPIAYACHPRPRLRGRRTERRGQLIAPLPRRIIGLCALHCARQPSTPAFHAASGRTGRSRNPPLLRATNCLQMWPWS